MTEEKQVQFQAEVEKNAPLQVVEKQATTEAGSEQAPKSIQSSLTKIIDSQASQTKPTQKESSPEINKQEQPELKKDSQEQEKAGVFKVSKSATVTTLPLLRKHQALDYSIPGHQVKVDLIHIKQTIYLWETITRCAKRKLFIYKGYIYCLEPTHFGYFVVGIWDLNELTNIKIWDEESRMKLTFAHTSGKAAKQRQFRIVDIRGLKAELSKQLVGMGKTLF